MAHEVCGWEKYIFIEVQKTKEMYFENEDKKKSAFGIFQLRQKKKKEKNQ